MDTERLRYFTVIAETGSLTKASQILGISHSGLSKAVSSLESETKIKLFRPLGRGLEITQEGKWFYQKAQEILRIASEISQGQQEKRKLIRMGITETIAITCASYLSQELKDSLCISQIDVGEVEGQILSEALDFGIAFIPAPKPELEYLEIGEVYFSSFASEDLIEKHDPEKLPFAVPLSNFPANPLGYKNRDGWPSDVSRNAHFFISNFAIGLELVKSSQAAIYMPDFVADLENQKNKTQLKKLKAFKDTESKRKLYLIKRQSSEESKEMKKTTKTLRNLCC